MSDVDSHDVCVLCSDALLWWIWEVLSWSTFHYILHSSSFGLKQFCFVSIRLFGKTVNKMHWTWCMSEQADRCMASTDVTHQWACTIMHEVQNTKKCLLSMMCVNIQSNFSLFQFNQSQSVWHFTAAISVGDGTWARVNAPGVTHTHTHTRESRRQNTS